MKSRVTFAAVAVCLLTLGACGGSDGADIDTAASSTTAAVDGEGSSIVVLKGNKYVPEVVTISTGETVTWEWDDGAVAHDVNGGDAFKSEIQPDGTFEHTF